MALHKGVVLGTYKEVVYKKVLENHDGVGHMYKDVCDGYGLWVRFKLDDDILLT